MYSFNEALLWKENNICILINDSVNSELSLTDHIEQYYDLNITIEKEN